MTADFRPLSGRRYAGVYFFFSDKLRNIYEFIKTGIYWEPMANCLFGELPGLQDVCCGGQML